MLSWVTFMAFTNYIKLIVERVGSVQIMLDATEEVGGIFLITADHGNAEDMVKRNPKTGAPVKDKSGNYQILTSHTCAPVSWFALVKNYLLHYWFILLLSAIG